MLKHIPSKADLDVLIDDDGNLFIFCKSANKLWTGKLTPSSLSDAGSKSMRSRSTSTLKATVSANRAAFQSIGMKDDLIDSLLK